MMTRPRYWPALMCATLLSVACGNSSPDELVRSARANLDKNEVASAEIELKNALKENPQLAEGRYLLGVAALAQSQYATAEAEFKRALELQYPADKVVPKLALAIQHQGAFARVIKEISPIMLTEPGARADTLAIIGNAHLAAGAESLAVEAYQRAREAVPEHVGATLGLARLAASKGDTKAALQSVEAVLARAPKTAEAWELKGLLMLTSGDMNAAVEAWQKQISLERDATMARVRLATLLIRTNRYKEAASEIEVLKKTAPKMVQTHYLVALLAYREKRLEAAREALGQLQKGAPDFLPGLVLAGMVELSLRGYPVAQKNFERALTIDPNHRAAALGLVRALLQDNQAARAGQVIEPLLAAHPKDATLASLAGEVYMAAGNTTGAAAEMTRAAQLKPGDTGLATKMALGRFVQGKPEEGFAELENLSTQNPADHRPDLTLIAARLHQRQYDQALVAIDKLEKKLPKSPLPLNLRGAALLGKADVEGARKAFEKALMLHPDDFGAAMNLAQLDLAANVPQAAVARFESMLARNPKNLQVIMSLADLRARMGASGDEVASLIEQAIGHYPNDPMPRLALIALRMRQQDVPRAIAAAQAGLNAVGERPEMLEAAAAVQESAGQYGQAIALWQKLADLKNTSPAPLLRLAHAQILNRDFDPARASLRRAQELAPRAIEVQREWMSLELAAGRESEALAVARRVQQSDPKAVMGYVLETDFYLVKRQWSAAAEAAQRGLKQVASSELALRAHQALSAQGQADEAARFAREWVKANPSDLAMPMRLGDVAALRGDYANARQHYQAALSRAPDNPMLLNNVAWVSWRLKDPAALELAEKAHRLAPQSATIKDTLATILADRGQVPRAVELLTAATRIAPADANIRLNYARLLIRAGNKPEARRQLDVLAALGDRFRGQGEVAQLLKQL